MVEPHGEVGGESNGSLSAEDVALQRQVLRQELVAHQRHALWRTMLREVVVSRLFALVIPTYARSRA